MAHRRTKTQDSLAGWRIGLLAALVGAGCAQDLTPGDSAAQKPSPTTAIGASQPCVGRETAMQTIDRAQLKECVDGGGIVALVEVDSAKILWAGTLSESVRIHAHVGKVLHGPPLSDLQLQRYTSKSNPVLQSGRRYVVAARPNPRYAPGYALGGFVEVPAGAEDDAVQAHAALLKEISGAP